MNVAWVSHEYFESTHALYDIDILRFNLKTHECGAKLMQNLFSVLHESIVKSNQMPQLRDGESDESDKEKDKVEWASPTNRTALDVLMIFGGENVGTIGLHCNRAMHFYAFLPRKQRLHQILMA